MCRIPQALSAKVIAYYDYVMNRRIHPQDEEILAGLSGSLRQQACILSALFWIKAYPEIM